MAWSEKQQVALAIVPKFSSILSLFGSCWIVVEVITENENPRRRKRFHPYHRLLFAMSVYDILESVWNFASTWPIPEGTEDVWQPIGTQQTCSAQGFFLTLSVAVPIYNAMLALYYLLVINYNVRDHVLKKWVEPSMHLVAMLWAFGTAIYSAASGLINNANLWCWIAPLPAGCKDSWRYGEEANCVRGDNAWIYRWAFYFAPLWYEYCVTMQTSRGKGSNTCSSQVLYFLRDSVHFGSLSQGSYVGLSHPAIPPPTNPEIIFPWDCG